MRTMELRLYPNRTQEKVLLDDLEKCCFLYNHLLEHCRDAGERNLKHPSEFDLNHEIVVFKKEHLELTAVYSEVLTNVSTRVSMAFAGFFRRLKAREKAGYPRFRSRTRYDSLTYPQKGFSVKDGRLQLSKIGSIRASGFRKMFGKLKTCTVKREGTGPNYRWKACLTYESEEISSLFLEDTRPPAGIDLGLKDVAVVSDGRRYPNRYNLKRSEGKVADIQRKMMSHEKGSPGWLKFKQRLYHAYERLTNIRKAQRYDTVNDLIKRYSFIAVEDIDVKRIQEKSLGKEMRKSYRDASWNMFLKTLCIKAAEVGCMVVRVNPAYTSQRCSWCGRTVPKDLSVRRHVCACGLDIDRDENAARNILRLGLQAQQP